MADSDQDNYTIEEMMQRLRNRERAQSEKAPELVTRPDGSQVMRVRKRKRRSRQPHKEREAQSRKRMLVVSALVTVLVVAAALGVLAWIVFLNSAGYRERILARIGDWSGAEVEVKQFRATPFSIGAGSFELDWPDSAPVRKLTVNSLRGDLRMSSHLTGEWSGQRLEAASGVLELAAASGEPAPHDIPATRYPFDFPVEVGRLAVKFGEGKSPALQVSDAQASFTVPDIKHPASNVVLMNGRTRIGSWGAFQLKFASLRLSPEGTRVGNIQLVPEGDADAEVRLLGDDLPVLALRGGESELEVRLDNVPSSVAFGAGLGKLIDGRFETPEPDKERGVCFVDVSRLDSLRLVVPVRATLQVAPTMLHLEMFATLAKQLDNPRLERPRFESEARAELRRDAEGVRLGKIDFSSHGSLRVTGELAATSGGELSGELEVGLPESQVENSLDRSIDAVFARASQGYRWATVKVSGTVDNPADDLTRQLQLGRPSGSTEIRGVARPGDRFRALTAPPEEE